MGDLFGSYADCLHGPGSYGLGSVQHSGAWDEMFESSGDVNPLSPRPHYVPLHDVLGTLSAEDYGARCLARDRSFRDQGITFSLSGELRPFPLDLVPRVVPAEEWKVIERGVAQRVRALEAFLSDVYGPQQILADRVLPRRLVLSSTHFHRQAARLSPPNGVRIHVAGIDLVRDAQGRYRVLEDNLRTPSGISYVVENRRAMTHVFPELFASYRVRAVADYPTYLLAALRAAAPTHVAGSPTVVVLTPGVHNSAYFEHSFLARQMGVALVEGRDLVCRDGVAYMRTTSGEERVDVIYRRVDDEFLDPLQFNPSSLLGCPGVLNAARAGNVTLANAVGNGVADDKALYPRVPDLVRYYLNEEPILSNVDTYLLEDPDQRGYVLGRLDQLVLKPVNGSGGYGLVIGPQASDEQLSHLATENPGQPERVDRPGRHYALYVPDLHWRRVRTEAHRPPPVRRKRRGKGVGGAGWAHPGGFAARQPGGQFEPGGRVQGHLGADPHRRGPGTSGGHRPQRFRAVLATTVDVGARPRPGRHPRGPTTAGATAASAPRQERRGTGLTC